MAEAVGTVTLNDPLDSGGPCTIEDRDFVILPLLKKYTAPASFWPQKRRDSEELSRFPAFRRKHVLHAVQRWATPLRHRRRKSRLIKALFPTFPEEWHSAPSFFSSSRAAPCRTNPWPNPRRRNIQIAQTLLKYSR